MGCFNQSCVASNLTIHLDDKVRLFLIKARPSSQYSFSPSEIFYTPVMLPIQGYYDEYGCKLKNIVADEVVKHLETEFEVSIDDFLHNLADGEYDFEYCLMLDEVYQEIIHINQEHITNKIELVYDDYQKALIDIDELKKSGQDGDVNALRKLRRIDKHCVENDSFKFAYDNFGKFKDGLINLKKLSYFMYKTNRNWYYSLNQQVNQESQDYEKILVDISSKIVDNRNSNE